MNSAGIQLISEFHRPDFRIRFVSIFLLLGWLSFFIFYYTHNVFSPQKPMPMSFHFPANLFCDFFSPFDMHARFKLASQSNYFPFASIFFEVLNNLSKGNPYRAVFLSILSASFFLVFLVYQFLQYLPKQEKILNSLVLTLCSFPVFFCMHTGNIEVWVFIFICFGFLLHVKNLQYLSVLSLAVATAIKGYPGIFLIFFIQKKEYRAITLFFVCLFVLTTLPFVIWDTSVHNYFISLKTGMGTYAESMIHHGQGSRFGHSLMNTTRVFFPEVHGAWAKHLTAYYVVCVVVILFFSLYTSIFEKSFWKRSFIWVALTCLLPPTSTDYKLLLFLIPFLLYCRDDNRNRFDLLYTLSFGLLFIDKGYIYFGDLYMTLNAVANTCIISFILLLVLLERIPTFRGNSLYRTGKN